ncbi:hypothetical protein [Rheinheimera maricola]|uniref:Uncharacterized protein n=1 Tax=Rheinheimera maricola TaxID=2793282 RepID=A0ABS7X5H3_9GAMM|nr:hypothetical protein [Rheinheimera maricola]MBZ9610424.1 hypothetical protein [Rheinheimera maricola]
MKFKITFQQNIKATLKFLSLVMPAIGLFIIVDSIKEDDYSNLMILVYLLAAMPLVVLSTATYTELKVSPLNKFLCSVLFAFATTVFVIAYYFLAWFIDGSELGFPFLQRMSVIMFIVLAGIYLQLPWKLNGV